MPSFGKCGRLIVPGNSDKPRRLVVILSISAFAVLIGFTLGFIILGKDGNCCNSSIENESDTSIPSTSEPPTTSAHSTSEPPTTAAPSTSEQATFAQTLHPSDVFSPTTMPTSTPQPTINVTYRPGILTGYEVDLYLSQGLTAKIIAESGKKIEYYNGNTSDVRFHGRPDFGATFPDPDLNNTGGWIYVSNSEMKSKGKGGVGAIKFDKDGNVLDYRMLLTGTTMNCGGGRTPWGTWVSCEELSNYGQIYQVDPTGARKAEKLTMGLHGDRFESFAYDDRNLSEPYFFATADRPRGALHRWTPTNFSWDEPWSVLHGQGNLSFLFLKPSTNDSNTSGGTFEWTTNYNDGMDNAGEHFPETEAIDRVGSILYFVSKARKVLYMLDLDTMRFTRQSTVHGLFDGAGDQIQRILADDDGDQILYFTEERDGGGIHGRNSQGQYFTIVEGKRSLYRSESTGLAFSPDGHHMYFAYQKNGLLFDVTRKDGLPFHGRSLDVHYHNYIVRRSLRL